MKMILDIKNPRAIDGFPKDTVILYDGKQWYLTSKDDLLAEAKADFKAKSNQFDAFMRKYEAKWSEFMKNYTSQNDKLIELIGQIAEKKEII